MYILIFFLAHWFLSLFFQTFYLHRYASHKMFSTGKVRERIFHFLTFVCQGSSFLNPRAYALMHREHHAYSDTEKDPHSPHFFRDVFQMMYYTSLNYGQHLRRLKEPEARFKGNLPEWPLIDKWGSTIASRLVFVGLYTWFYIAFATSWWMFLLLPVHYIMGPLHGAIVNWCGHKYGYANFDNGDKSKNSTPFDFLMLGELFQNNHHRSPNKANFGAKWFELDPVYPVMKFMHWVRLIKLRKPIAG
ncbi:acyl-CoA desaturase [Mucilaginibacter limnophilus]|uniref:Acyl-CoA desaturase n=1 Tax=Mucilaginibacter limnophilus TaxID=1932778 RepID=A0A437MVU4_9SPHI|nr:acyl-CoA desaturase [Mucilaginibacter limnophilus]RVU01782.1 acyl-CoA desaturase [Mucilaginibacter limnophilus]